MSKSLSEHATGIITLAIFSLGLSLIVMGLFWMIAKLICAIEQAHIKRKMKDPEYAKKKLEEDQGHYMVHGVYCPNCDKFVPRELRCVNCGKVFRDLIIDPEYRRILEEQKPELLQ